MFEGIREPEKTPGCLEKKQCLTRNLFKAKETVLGARRQKKTEGVKREIRKRPKNG